MADNVSMELMDERLRDIQARLAELPKLRNEMHEGFASTKGYLASFLKDQSMLEERLAGLEVEMDRVKRRLDLSDEPQRTT